MTYRTSHVTPTGITRTAFLLAFSMGFGIAKADDGTHFFETQIRPVLVEHCYECHSVESKKSQGGLLVDSRVRLQKGGDSGPAVVPHDAEKSLILEALRYESVEMPPSGKLDEAVIAKFEQWIKGGAVDPREVVEGHVGPVKVDWDEAKLHWSFQPIARCATPESAFADSGAVSRNDVRSGADEVSYPNYIDAYLANKLYASGVTPNPPADRLTWLRRVTFDLIGLPPTPEEQQAFAADERPDSFERVVDRLLTSPRYGERYARHWLDLARYADSNGADENHGYPVAWRYRDYVVEAFNNDTPYDRFIVEQLAGDLLSANSEQERRRNLTATGFLVLGPKMLAEQDKPKLVADLVDEQLDTVGKVFLGLTLGCARCHDHKFDPIRAQDYYALAGIFHSTQTMEHLQFVSQWSELELPDRERSERIAAHHQQITAAQSDATKLESELRTQYFESQLQVLKIGMRLRAEEREPNSDEASQLAAGRSALTEKVVERIMVFAAQHPWRATHGLEKRGLEKHGLEQLGTELRGILVVAEGVSSEQLHAAVIDAVRSAWREVIGGARNDQGKLTDKRLAKLHRGLFEEGPFNEARKIEDVIAENDRSRLAAAHDRVETLKKSLPALDRAMATSDGPVKLVAINIRGNHLQTTGDPLPRDVPLVLQPTTSTVVFPAEQSGRLEFANWLIDPNHPLTARVMVNRLWQYHFGNGLVPSASNFGLSGDSPTHPELLDRLATEFIDCGWSIKEMHRTMVLSAAYRRSSIHNPDSELADPNNTLLWKMNRRRLEVEPLRDSLLAVADAIDWQMTGQAAAIYGATFEDTGAGRTLHDAARRTIYLPINRAALEEFFSTFDYVDSAVSLEKRPVTTVPHQALYLMNHRLALYAGWKLAGRLENFSSDESERIKYAYAICFGRAPTLDELAAAKRFLEAVRASLTSEGGNVQEEHARESWIRLCRSLLITNEFIYIE